MIKRNGENYKIDVMVAQLDNVESSPMSIYH